MILFCWAKLVWSEICLVDIFLAGACRPPYPAAPSRAGRTLRLERAKTPFCCAPIVTPVERRCSTAYSPLQIMTGARSTGSCSGYTGAVATGKLTVCLPQISHPPKKMACGVFWDNPEFSRNIHPSSSSPGAPRARGGTISARTNQALRCASSWRCSKPWAQNSVLTDGASASLGTRWAVTEHGTSLRGVPACLLPRYLYRVGGMRTRHI